MYSLTAAFLKVTDKDCRKMRYSFHVLFSTV